MSHIVSKEAAEAVVGEKIVTVVLSGQTRESTIVVDGKRVTYFVVKNIWRGHHIVLETGEIMGAFGFWWKFKRSPYKDLSN